MENSLDWEQVGTKLRSSMQAAPAQCRKDLARMIGHIDALVQDLAREEVNLRRYKKTTNSQHQAILEKVNESINEYEKWLVLAHLQHG